MKRSRNKTHSTGAIYITVINNPETIRFLPSEMHLAIVLPGPEEPTLEQLNEVIAPLIDEFIRLYEGIPIIIVLCFALTESNLSGIRVHVHGLQEQQPVNGMLYLNTSDLPASRKVSGLLWALIGGVHVHMVQDSNVYSFARALLRSSKYAAWVADAFVCLMHHRAYIAEHLALHQVCVQIS